MVTNAAPWRSFAELVEATYEGLDKMRTHSTDEVERILIRAALSDGGVADRDLDWMTSSCPSLRTAQRFYPKRKP